MNLDTLKLQLQQHLTDGTVLVIGSGLSAGVGVSTMPQLSAYLSKSVPPLLTASTEAEWRAVSQMLETGADLESALNKIEISAELDQTIVGLTARLIAKDEITVARKVLEGNRQLPLSELLQRLIAVSESIPVITTNYDRLIELAAECTDVGVDSTFYGQVLGRFDPGASREAMGYGAPSVKGRTLKRNYRRHIKLHKPHGSLDWFVRDGFPIRSSFPLELPRLMVPPGKSKYLKGYEQPFDQHRSAANDAIDKAARFLVIGFGFNDPHLESHLIPKITHGAPCVILTKHLTERARTLAKSVPSVLALSEFVELEQAGTNLIFGTQEYRYHNVDLWGLESFLAEVFS